MEFSALGGISWMRGHLQPGEMSFVHESPVLHPSNWRNSSDLALVVRILHQECDVAQLLLSIREERPEGAAEIQRIEGVQLQTLLFICN